MSTIKTRPIEPIADRTVGLGYGDFCYRMETHDTTPATNRPSINSEAVVHVPDSAAVGSGVAGEQVPAASCAQKQNLPPDDVVFDQARFREYIGDDNELIGTVVRNFLTVTPGRLTAIRAALSAGDAQTLARVAHSLKGSVSFLAAAPTLDAVCTMETLAAAEDLRGAAAASAPLESEIDRLTAELTLFLARTLRDYQP